MKYGTGKQTKSQDAHQSEGKTMGWTARRGATGQRRNRARLPAAGDGYIGAIHAIQSIPAPVRAPGGRGGDGDGDGEHGWAREQPERRRWAAAGRVRVRVFGPERKRERELRG